MGQSQHEAGRFREFSLLRMSLSLGLLISLCSGCAAIPGNKNSTSSDQNPTAVQTYQSWKPATGGPWQKGDEVPEFSGPWKSDLIRAYKSTTNDMQRAVLQDGKITEQEHGQIQDAFGQCIAAQGFSEYEYHNDDTYSFRQPKGWSHDQVDEVEDKCEKDTRGEVLGLYFQMRKNPQCEDRMELMASCLVRSKLVPEGYTGADYMRDGDRSTFQFDIHDPRLKQCSDDPKGIVGGS